MRILQINKFHTVQGGADKYYLDLTEELKKNGHEVANFAMQRSDNLETPWSKYFVSPLDFSMQNHPLKNIKNSLRVIGRSFWSFEAAKKLEQLIKDFKPEVAHLHTFYHQLSPSILPVLKKYNIPVVMTVHDYNLISCNYVRYHDGKICSHTINGKYWKAVVHKCVKDSYLASSIEALSHYFFKCLKIYEKHIDAFIFPSNFHALEHSKSKLGMKRSLIINNYFEPDGKLPEENIGKYIVYIGRLSAEKGVDILIKAYAKSDSGLKLVIVGDGPELENLKELAAKLNIDAIFLGKLEHSEAMEIVKRSAFKVFPSRALENQPLSVLEAMAAGKPVIASDIGGLNEIITDRETGLLFEPGNSDDLALKIKKLSNDSQEIIDLGQRANKKIYRFFNKDLHLEKLNNTYQQLIRAK